MLSVSLSQHDATSYPSISADVGMLVDEEGDGDWGNARIASLFSAQEVHANLLDMLEKSLPRLYESLRTALRKSGVK